jgi:hypothetical protein
VSTARWRGTASENFSPARAFSSTFGRHIGRSRALASLLVPRRQAVNGVQRGGSVAPAGSLAPPRHGGPVLAMPALGGLQVPYAAWCAVFLPPRWATSFSLRPEPRPGSVPGPRREEPRFIRTGSCVAGTRPMTLQCGPKPWVIRPGTRAMACSRVRRRTGAR